MHNLKDRNNNVLDIVIKFETYGNVYENLRMTPKISSTSKKYSWDPKKHFCIKMLREYLKKRNLSQQKCYTKIFPNFYNTNINSERPLLQFQTDLWKMRYMLSGILRNIYKLLYILFLFFFQIWICWNSYKNM